MHEMKFGKCWALALLGLLLSGCAGWHLDALQTLDPATITEGISQEQATQLVQAWLGDSNVVAWVEGLLTDEQLMAQLESAWNQFESSTGVSIGSSGTADSSSDLPSIGGGKTVTGYGPVNYAWQMSDSVLEDGLAYMQAQNVRWFVWEYVGNAGEDVLGSTQKLATANSRFLKIQAECKARGIWCAPILFNDNAGDGDYQNGGVKLASRLSQAKNLIDFVAAHADPAVCSITITSEIQTSAGEQLESYGRAKLVASGIRLDYNGSGRPSSKPSGYSGLRCWHVCDINAWPAADTIWLNDCGASIRTVNPEAGDAMRAMSADGTLYGAGNVAVIEAYKNKAAARGQFVFARYGFQDKTFDKPAIAALSMPH